MTLRQSGPRDNAFDVSRLHVKQPPVDHLTHLREFGLSAVVDAVPADLAAGAADDLLALHHGVWGNQASSATGRRAQRHLAWRLDEAPDSVRSILAHPSIRSIAADAYGRDDIRFTAWVIFYRPPGEQGTFWHSDAGFIPIDGPILQFWMPVIEPRSAQGLLFRSDDPADANVYSFGGMTPGALSYHAVDTMHAGRTYDEMTLALSFITHVDGSRLRSSDDPLHAHGRELFRSRIFPDRAYGARAENANTPLLSEL